MFQVESIATHAGIATLVRVRGDLDIASAGALTSVLRAARETGTQRVIVSLEDCRFCDSSGLAVLIGSHVRMRPPLAIVIRPGTQVERLFQITGMAERLAVYESLAAATGAGSPDGGADASGADDASEAAT